MPHKIGIVGISIECNAKAPVTTLNDFKKTVLIDGPVPMEALQKLDPELRLLPDDLWFETVFLAHATSGGPVDHSCHLEMRARMLSNLQAQGPFDGILVIGHGAGLTTLSEDLDGDYLLALRACVGPDVPIATFLDLHGNISKDMYDSTDIIVGMRENPHTDIPERLRDTALLLQRLLTNRHLYSAWRSVPLMTPQVSQLSAKGQPFGDLMQFAQTHAAQWPTIIDFSLFPGFAFNDVSYFGFDVLAYGTDQADLDKFADLVASELWDMRDQFKRDLTNLDDALADFKRAPTPQIWADVADNPGGGARSNTTYALKALHQAGITNAAIGLHFDPPLVDAAFAVGQGNTFEATFTAQDPTETSIPCTAHVQVFRLMDSPVKNTSGQAAGQLDSIGRSVALRLIDGPLIIATELRRQILTDDYFTHHGLNTDDWPLLVVKSRGHFRAGFKHLQHSERVLELNLPGLAPADLKQYPFIRRRRPLYPLEDLMYPP